MLDVLTYFAKFCKITSRTGATTFPFFIFPIYVFFRADPTCNNGAGHADEEGCPSPAAFINGHPKATALVRQMKGKTETHKACGLTGHISKWPCLGACCLATAYIHPLWFLFSFLSFLPFFFFFAKRRLEWSWLQNMHTCLDASCVVLGLFCPSSQFFVPLSPFYFTLQWTFCIIRVLMQNGTWWSTHEAIDVKLSCIDTVASVENNVGKTAARNATSELRQRELLSETSWT